MNIHLDPGEHMRLGYNQPLYLLSFDSRYSYPTATLHLNAPLTAGQGDAIANGKDVIYDGLRQALGHAVPVASGGVVVNEDSDAGILRDASTNGYVTVLSTERSGSSEFDFAYGAEFASHIAAVRPTFAKARVRYNPEGDAAVNRWQTARLQQLSDHCRAVGQRFMCELRVPPTAAQRKHVDALGTTYDLLMRPALVLQAIRALQDAGVEPDVWTVEGFDRRQDCEQVVATARRGGRSEVGCVVLGQNAGRERVMRWLENAASVPGFVGFAIGRTAFRNAVTAYAANQVTRQEAAWLVARRYREWTAIFERGSHSRVDAA